MWEDCSRVRVDRVAPTQYDHDPHVDPAAGDVGREAGGLLRAQLLDGAEGRVGEQHGGARAGADGGALQTQLVLPAAGSNKVRGQVIVHAQAQTRY